MDKDLKLRKDAAQFENIYSREVVLRAPSVKEESRSIRGVVATELPVVVMDWARWEPIREALIVDGGNIPDKVPLLDTHSRFEVSNIKGSVTNFDFEADEKLGMILTGDNVFSKTAESEFTLAKEGHLDSTSIGYRVYESESVTLAPGMSVEIDGRKFTNDYADKLPLVIRKKWDLLENSLVPIGADKAAKFRSMFTSDVKSAPIESDEKSNIINEIRNAVNETSKQLKIIINKEGQSKMDENTNLVEKQRVDSINKLAQDFKDEVKGFDLQSRAKLFVDGGKTANDFSDLIMKNLESQAAVAKPTLDLPKSVVEKYSIQRAVAHLLDPKKGNCLEMEISRAYQAASGVESTGFVIPHNLMNEKAQYLKRDVNSTATSGGDFIGTDHLSGEWIDTLKNETIAAQLGVRFLPGRKGNISIPKLTTGNTFGWAATENAVVLESTPVTTKVEMSPKRGGFFVDLSKQAILQSDPALDSVLTEDGRMIMAIGLDQGFFHGDGSGGAFTGIANTSNVQTESAASFAWQTALNYAKKVKLQNAGIGELKFAFNASVEAELMGRAKEAGYPVYIIGEDNKLAGRPYLVSNQISDDYVFFGAWNQAYMALWDGIDVTVDPYTLATYNLVRIVFNQLADCAVRYPQAFVVSAGNFS